jgi:vitamin B12 transporter
MPRTLSLTLLAIALAAVEPSSPTIIVTAERGESELLKAPVTVNLVTADDIQTRGGAQQMTDWLKDLPGVGVWGANGGVDGGIVSVRLRGLGARYTLFLVDGIPQADGSSPDGSPRMPMLQVAGLDRVEVLQGAQSGLYGSGAVGGVVNFRTVRPTSGQRVQVTASVGSFGTYGGEVVASGPIAAGSGYAAAVNGLSSSGFSSSTTDPDGDPLGFEDDSVNRMAGRARFEHRLGTDALWYASGSMSKNIQEFDGGFPANPDESFSENRYKQWNIDTGGQFGGKDRGLSIDASMQRSRNASYYLSGDPTLYDAEMLYVSARTYTVLPVGFRMSGGVDARRDEAKAGTDLDAEVDNLGLYASMAWGDQRTTIEATGRVDHHEQFGSHSTGRLVAGWFAVPERLKVRGAISSGFKAPSLYEMYGSNPFYLIANPDLEPETAVAYEAGTDWMPATGVEMSCTVFRTMVENQIDWLDPDFDWVGSYGNIDGSTVSSGFEAGASVAHALTTQIDGRLEGTYTYLEANDPLQHTSPYSPQHAGSVRATVEESVGAEWRLRQSLGARRTTAYYGRAGEFGRVDGVTVADAVLGASLGERWDISLRVDNLFDESYSVNAPSATSTYSTAPRSYTLTAVAKF